MQCTRCYSNMQLVKREDHQSSLLEWHQCPLCQRIEFLSQPAHHNLDQVHYTAEAGDLKTLIR